MKCSEVKHPGPEHTTNPFFRRDLIQSGALLWDFHGNEGHVLTEEIDCNDEHYCGACGGMVKHKFWTCECEQIWPVDWHHYWIIMIPVVGDYFLGARK